MDSSQHSSAWQRKANLVGYSTSFYILSEKGVPSTPGITGASTNTAPASAGPAPLTELVLTALHIPQLPLSSLLLAYLHQHFSGKMSIFLQIECNFSEINSSFKKTSNVTWSSKAWKVAGTCS